MQCGKKQKLNFQVYIQRLKQMANHLVSVNYYCNLASDHCHYFKIKDVLFILT